MSIFEPIFIPKYPNNIFYEITVCDAEGIIYSFVCEDKLYNCKNNQNKYHYFIDGLEKYNLTRNDTVIINTYGLEVNEQKIRLIIDKIIRNGKAKKMSEKKVKKHLSNFAQKGFMFYMYL